MLSEIALDDMSGKPNMTHAIDPSSKAGRLLQVEGKHRLHIECQVSLSQSIKLSTIAEGMGKELKGLSLAAVFDPFTFKKKIKQTFLSSCIM